MNFVAPDCFLNAWLKGIEEHYWRGVISGIFVFLLLWVFRTYDTRQAISKTNIQIQQSKLFNGLDNLVSEDPLKIEIGVFQLIELSKSGNEFNLTIQFAFIKRLKKIPLSDSEIKRHGTHANSNDPYSSSGDYFNNQMREYDPDAIQPRRGIRLTYAQHILKWLIKHGEDDLDLSRSNFSQQDFQIENLQLGEIFTHKNKSCGCAFENAELHSVDFRNAYLVDANMHSANLCNAHLEGANLRGAALDKACLHDAFVDQETSGFEDYLTEKNEQGEMRILRKKPLDRDQL